MSLYMRHGLSVAISLLATLGPALVWADEEPLREGEKLAFLAVAESFWQVWLLERGAAPRQVTRSAVDKTSLSWFPDGARLLVNSQAGQTLEVDIATGTERSVGFEREGILDAQLSPDGQRIAFSWKGRESEGPRAIWVWELRRRRLRSVAQVPGRPRQPAWSRDGRWLYFIAGRQGRNEDIWRVAADGGEVQQVTAGSGRHLDIAPGPGGKIAFSASRGRDYDVWTWDFEAWAAPSRQTTGRGFDGAPCWSKGHSHLYFESVRNGVPNLWQIELGADGGKAVPVTSFGDGGARHPVAWWSP